MKKSNKCELGLLLRELAQNLKSYEFVDDGHDKDQEKSIDEPTKESQRIGEPKKKNEPKSYKVDWGEAENIGFELETHF